MSNTYAGPAVPRPDPPPEASVVPDQVVVSMAEIAQPAKDSLLAAAVGLHSG